MVSMMSSEDVPAKDRFEWFADVVAHALAPTQISHEGSDDFRAEASVVDLGSVRLSEFSYVPLRSRRTPALIRKGDPEQYNLAFVTGSPMWMSQRRNESGLVTGDMLLWDTSFPYESGARDEGQAVRAAILQFPKSVMPIPVDKVDRILAHRISARSGVGAVLAQMIGTLGSHGAECTEQERGRLGRVALDLAGACIARHLNAVDDLPPESRATALRAEIHAFINDNLGDGALTPSSIADRHHISLRRLHLLFQGQAESVAAVIRRRRLEQCRIDLTRDDLLHHPVHAIAVRWGFTSASVFNRAFRQAYRTTPTELRRQAGRAARIVEDPCADGQPVRRGRP
ncbi:helix-turn-helix domain-containing protein [Kitasatospora sp. NPDC057015]|uniref:AraC-like ligand-binding domain-containing protein n=1 Tax=Kitasatospora sp. NPDC057015 TaxID=3346001 RepID=UPI003630E706